ncbi:peptidoglycan editing factor PgeF [Solicola gregarius]|uniref:Purine nucleoside phosphorylase n=1 Tax=Solicola gregarius TaxID=2908642 RepID=A0AA46YLB5_9ACTN|nr:peptidoglycan editing factor PgeF [Solicola gregarius]UYM05351.1 peptidoglycan editing factor PgeF [Solicola gregarius]
MFAFRDRAGGADLAFTDRHGGASVGPWESLNLGTSNGDDAASVERNLDDLAAAFGADRDSMVRMSQFHGNDVHVVASDHDGSVPRADALVTDVPGVSLLVRVADCAPVVLVAPDDGVVGVVHAGREGVANGVVVRTVEAMRDLGAGPVHAWIGPRACGACYEVPAEMRARVSAIVPATHATTPSGTPSLDLAAGLAAQLSAVGVAITDLAEHRAACTIEGVDDYFSYRRQGQQSGRLGALVRLRP